MYNLHNNISVSIRFVNAADLLLLLQFVESTICCFCPILPCLNLVLGSLLGVVWQCNQRKKPKVPINYVQSVTYWRIILRLLPSMQQLANLPPHSQQKWSRELKATFEYNLQQYLFLFNYTYPCIKHISTFTCLHYSLLWGQASFTIFYICNIHQRAQFYSRCYRRNTTMRISLS